MYISLKIRENLRIQLEEIPQIDDLAQSNWIWLVLRLR